MNPSEPKPFASRDIPITMPDGYKIMTLPDLLLKTADTLDLNPGRPVSLIKTVYNIMRPHVPYHYIGNHVTIVARALAEYSPTELAPIINRFPSIRRSHDVKSAFQMLDEAEQHIRNRYGRRHTAGIIGIWLRRTAEGRPYPAVNATQAA